MAVQDAELLAVAGRAGTSEDRCSGWPTADIVVLQCVAADAAAAAAAVVAENTAVGSAVSARTAEA